jgi:hypothetical protein
VSCKSSREHLLIFFYFPNLFVGGYRNYDIKRSEITTDAETANSLCLGGVGMFNGVRMKPCIYTLAQHTCNREMVVKPSGLTLHWASSFSPVSQVDDTRYTIMLNSFARKSISTDLVRGAGAGASGLALSERRLLLACLAQRPLSLNVPQQCLHSDGNESLNSRLAWAKKRTLTGQPRLGPSIGC